MKRTAISSAAIAIVATSISLTGCSSSSDKHPASPTSAGASAGSSATSASPKSDSKVATRINNAGPNPSIASYLQDAHITATPVHKGDPGAPTINFPVPDGWADAGSDTPANAYWAIIDKGPEAADYSPSIVATVSKLDGDVDPQKLIELAPGGIKNLPGFKPMGDGSEDNLGGFPAFQLGGTWTQDGKTKAVADKIVVINGKDDIYLLELNADCLEGQIEKALPATITIDEKTTITP